MGSNFGQQLLALAYEGRNNDIKRHNEFIERQKRLDAANDDADATFYSAITLFARKANQYDRLKSTAESQIHWLRSDIEALKQVQALLTKEFSLLHPDHPLLNPELQDALFKQAKDKAHFDPELIRETFPEYPEEFNDGAIKSELSTLGGVDIPGVYIGEPGHFLSVLPPENLKQAAREKTRTELELTDEQMFDADLLASYLLGVEDDISSLTPEIKHSFFTSTDDKERMDNARKEQLEKSIAIREFLNWWIPHARAKPELDRLKFELNERVDALMDKYQEMVEARGGFGFTPKPSPSDAQHSDGATLNSDTATTMKGQ